MLVAFSGGLDSTVLLHAAVSAMGAARVVAAHVHHGLQPAADAWPDHCAGVAGALGVRFECLRLATAPGRGDSVEAWARTQRYRALIELARRIDAAALLTAHHADDQVETLLMRIARGTGPEGLAGIRAEGRIDGVTLLRPLLALHRRDLEEHARRHGLAWIEDPTNADGARLRNAIRLGVLPAIDAAAPGFRANLLRLAGGLDDTLRAAAELAAIDLDAARMPDGAALDGTRVAALDRTRLAALPAHRCRAALRAWLAGLGARPPSEAKLAEIERQLVAAQGPYGWVKHDGWHLRRDRHLVDAQPADAGAAPGAAPQALGIHWRGEAEMALAGFGGRLLFELGPAGEGVSAEWLRGHPLRVTPWASAARLRPRQGGSSRTLKNLFQERAVPAWARAGMPLVWAGDRVLYAAGIGMDRGDWPEAGARVSLRWAPAPGDPRSAFCAASRV